eukprot:6022218-Amphidinium_carterae.1
MHTLRWRLQMHLSHLLGTAAWCSCCAGSQVYLSARHARLFEAPNYCPGQSGNMDSGKTLEVSSHACCVGSQ